MIRFYCRNESNHCGSLSFFAKKVQKRCVRLGIFELLLIAFAVSMDAFVASICRGLSAEKFNIKIAIVVGLYFSCFQAVMPLIGYFLGVQFQKQINNIDHWIAFGLLTVIGLNIIRESRKETAVNQEEHMTYNSPTSFRIMSVLAISTSIDALAVGVSLLFFRSILFRQFY